MTIFFSLLFISFIIGSCPAGEGIDIHINPPIKLDFKSKTEIYNLRWQYNAQYSNFIPEGYTPSVDIFGQIQDDKPWWGTLGTFFYGPGEKSIEGDSEESRFLLNPFLLVGLDGEYAVVKNKAVAYGEFFPMPVSLSWKQDGKTAEVVYRIGSFWREQKRYYGAQCNEFILVCYNARDFGYNYLYIDPALSSNNISSAAEKSIVHIVQRIHCGGSCGYPGGCNNMSPNQEELKMRIYSLPAVAHIKLWRNAPQDCHQEADMEFVIKMI